MSELNKDLVLAAIAQAMSKLEPGECLCSWTSASNHARWDHMRHDMHYLLRVFRRADGDLWMTSTPTLIGTNIDGEPRAEYPEEILYKVRGSDGSRRVVTAREVPDMSLATEASLCRRLHYDGGHYDLKSRAYIDNGLLRGLSTLMDGPVHDIPQIPVFWLAAPESSHQLHARKDLEPEALIPPTLQRSLHLPPFQWLLEHPSLMGAHPLTETDGIKRLAWPFHRVYGRGVLTVAFDCNWKWWRLAKTYDRPWLHIEHTARGPL